jgi:hypothetical protein
MKNTVKKLSASIAVVLCCIMLFSVTSMAQDDREGYWECIEVRHQTYDYNEALTDKNYWSNSKSGSAGTGTFSSTYVGPDEKDDYDPRPKNGESAMVQGSVSTPPKYIDGGKTVQLKVDLSISSTKQHFWDFDGDAFVRFDEVDVEMSHRSYGAIDFTAKDSDGEDVKLSVWLYAPTNWRSTEYGNNPKVNVEVSAQAPYGNEEGDKISIYTSVGMGSMSSRTEYVYLWHAEGKAPAEKKDDSDKPKRSDEEKRILDAWSNNQEKKTDETVVRDPEDTGIRFSDLWGMVAIRRGGGYDDEWEYCDLDTVIHYGDEIWTEADSGAVLSLTDMSTFRICENTIMAMPPREETVSSFKILAGNVWVNMKKMWEGGEFHVELKQGVLGIKGTTFAVEQTDEISRFYLFTSSAEVTSKITGEKVTLKPGEYAEVADDGIITVKTFDIPAKAEELILPMEILKDDGYKAGGNIIPIILAVVGVIAVIIVAVVIISKKRKTVPQMKEQTATQSTDVYREYEPDSPMPSVKKNFCGNCGSELKQGAKFCMKCGKKL